MDTGDEVVINVEDIPVNENLSGIYSITCIITNETYIGSSVRMSVRFREHKQDLNNHKHLNWKLQSVFDAYGENSLQFRGIFNCSPDMCLVYEQQILDKLYPKLNISAFASGSDSGRKFTDLEIFEIRKKYAVNKCNYWSVAKEYNCDRGTIRAILAGYTYRWLLSEEELKRLDGLVVQLPAAFHANPGKPPRALDVDSVNEIRNKYSTGKYSKRRLAYEYDVSAGVIDCVVNYTGAYIDVGS